LFDVFPGPNGALNRHLLPEGAEALRAAQVEFDPTNIPVQPPPMSVPSAARGQAPILKPLERVRFKSDNFSYQVLRAGEQLLIELLCSESGGLLPVHRHGETEHVWTILAVRAEAETDSSAIEIQSGDMAFIPAGAYHQIANKSKERLLLQQVSAPKPWEARFHASYSAGIRNPTFKATLSLELLSLNE
jgi:quercetin dioxygenase-like cupin family protein